MKFYQISDMSPHKVKIIASIKLHTCHVLNLIPGIIGLELGQVTMAAMRSLVVVMLLAATSLSVSIDEGVFRTCFFCPNL